MSSPTCIRCNRDLTLEVSIERGMGAICAGVVLASMLERGSTDKVDLPFDPETMDIIVERRADGLHFNIYPAITYHSPTGFEIGYGGSGPADFALNIVEMFLRSAGDKADTIVNGQATCAETWRIYQTFKWEFIASMPKEGGVIRGETIRTWIEEHRTQRPLFTEES